MKKEHLFKIQDIHHCCGVPLEDLINTYTIKQTQYIARATGNKGYVPNWLDIQGSYGDRAVKVMEEYAIRKLSYRESWIE